MQNLRTFAASCNLASDTIAHYAERGLLQPVLIGSKPHFTEQDRLRLQVIARGKRLGFSLGEIKSLMAAAKS